MSLLSKDDDEKIFDLFTKTNITDEFEFILTNHDNKYFGQEKYIQLLRYLKHKSIQSKIEIVNTDTLDVVYTHDTNTNYRVTITGIEKINKYISQLDLWKSHVIFKSLVRITNNKAKNKNDVKLLKKTRNPDNIIDIEDFYLRCKLSKEEEFTKEDLDICESLTHEAIPQISFRLKQRSTLFIVNNDQESIQIDLTKTKTTKNYKLINDIAPIYEVEIEYQKKSDKINSDKLKSSLNLMLSELMTIHKIIQQSNFVCTVSKKKQVLSFYRNIANVQETSTFLEARQPISLEIQYLTDILPNKYAVTDKADGDRYFLIIMNSHIYFISTNLNVKDSGINIKSSEYDGTILDGEYIFLSRLNRHLFLIFDALFIGLKDIRSEVKFMKRISMAEDLCAKIFLLGNQKGFIKNPYKSSGKFDLNDYKQYHKKEYTKCISSLNSDIKIETKYPLIRTKYFIDVQGIEPWEIFAYSEMLWKDYTENSDIGCPYILDGLIYQPLDQQYITNAKESKLYEYKWKPPQKNSIDFYIQFERDKNTGKILTVYDNSNDDYVRNKSYRICKLYCGKYNNQREVPELFNEEQQIYWAYLFLDNGEVRDEEGNILTDGTVVEFYYNSTQGEDIMIPERFRWLPMRTRYDKTESVQRYQRKYGNNMDVALKIWRSIQNPILYSDFEDLAKGNNPEKNQFFYDNKVEMLRKRIGHDLIVSAAKQNVYYQKITNLASPMRTFHNWVKSNIIYTYCNNQYKYDKPQTILDFGCGRGGDIMKFYYVAVGDYVGIDIAKEGLFSPINGAVSRYNSFRKNKPNFPKMTFIHADGGTKLTYEDQNRALGGMNNDNRLMINKYFGERSEKFDFINCQFVMHYFLKDDVTWNNFKFNINKCLKDGGFLITTHFDSKKVREYLGSETSRAGYYTDETGKKQKLFEITKKYIEPENNKPIGVGAAIDLFAAWMFEEGSEQTEYLIDTDFIWPNLEADCDLEVIESDLFQNLFYINESHFKQYFKYMHNPLTLKFLTDASKYYEDTEINKACQEFTFLQRFCIYKKKEKKEHQISRVKINKATGGTNTYIPKLSSKIYNDKYSFMNSIHYSLQSHQIIPKSVAVNEFYKDLEIEMIQDNKLNKTQMKKICSKINIEHNVENTKHHLINGLNIMRYKDGGVEPIINLGVNKKTMIVIVEAEIFAPLFFETQDGKQNIFASKAHADKLFMN